jgi:hypothetical protein
MSIFKIQYEQQAKKLIVKYATHEWEVGSFTLFYAVCQTLYMYKEVFGHEEIENEVAIFNAAHELYEVMINCENSLDDVLSEAMEKRALGFKE